MRIYTIERIMERNRKHKWKVQLHLEVERKTFICDTKREAFQIATEYEKKYFPAKKNANSNP